MKTIFRRIGGRIVPIKLGSFKLPKSSGQVPQRIFTAMDDAKKLVAKARVSFPKGKKFAEIMDVRVDKMLTRKGISTAMFDHIAKFTGKSGRKFVRSENVIHPAQVNIRSKFKSKFIADHVMNKNANIVDAKTAASMLRTDDPSFRYFHQIKASTMVRRKPKK